MCNNKAKNKVDYFQHLDAHACHSVLKALGSKVNNAISMPLCWEDSLSRNLIPRKFVDYKCYWFGCDEIFEARVNFSQHIDNHIKADISDKLRRGKSPKQFTCSWLNCKIKIRRISEFNRHIKSHANEKLIGCANIAEYCLPRQLCTSNTSPECVKVMKYFFKTQSR